MILEKYRQAISFDQPALVIRWEANAKPVEIMAA